MSDAAKLEICSVVPNGVDIFASTTRDGLMATTLATNMSPS